MSNSGEVPIACSLTGQALAARGGEWKALLATGQLAAAPVEGGIRLRVQPANAPDLLRLIKLEQDCCPWMDFSFRDAETVDITAAGEGQAVLREMFLTSPE